MKKKAVAALMAAVMMFSSLSVPVFARYNADPSDYVFKDTTGLEADIDAANNNAVVLTWPAVDKEGNLIKANPLKAEGQTESDGNPTRGWTNPTNGMIIEYTGWLPDGTHTSITNDTKSDHNVLMGVVDYPTDYQIVIKDPKVDTATSAQAVKIAYVDTTVVANSFATAYQVQYSLDGETWTEDHIASTFNHGKKLTRITQTQNAETGEMEEKLVDDKKNTFFLEDQITEPLTSSLQPNTKYYIRVNAYDASVPSTKNTPFKTFTTEITTPAEAEKTPAFASVEGGGKYSQGGRGGDVYVVTNLDDNATDPQPGSLRYGLLRKDRADGNVSAPRTIVFAVGGTINIDETVAKSARRMNITDNTTILGQTAPGEGITIAGSSMKFSGSNIIVRYMRFRLGSGYDLDAATATGQYIVIDHCSFGWGVDEVFSAKEIINSSIQYNIFSSGLAVPNKNGVNNTDPEVASGESEAKHGMGSILNGSDVSYTHNLWAHNGTRNPRFEGGFTYNGIRYENKLDFANNVVYDWGHNSTYGGERGNGQANFVGNYYKPGPETIEKVKTRFFDCDSSSEYKSSYYIDGNVMTSSDEVTADNTKGFYEMDLGAASQLTSKVELKEEYVPESAEAAYANVLANAGASKMRDPQDNRLYFEVMTGGGAFINDQAEAGGFDTAVFAQEITDTDNDGLPDDFETENGLNPNDSTDSCKVIEDETNKYNGYSYIEVYAGKLVDDWGENTSAYESEIPDGQIEKIVDENGVDVMAANNGRAVLTSGKSYTVEGTELVNAKVYLNDKIVAENGSLTFTPDEAGVYNLACLLGNVGSSRSFTKAVPVTVVKGEANLDGFSSMEIGSNAAIGVDRYDAETGTLYSQGSGRIGITKTSGIQSPDVCHFDYQMVNGDFDFIAKIDNLAKIDYLQKSGIMVRASLDPSSEFYMAALTYLKGEDYEGGTDVTGQSVKAKNIAAFVRTKDGANAAQLRFMGVPIVKQGQTPNSGYGRITRTGDKLTISSSLDKENWYTLWEFESTTLPETCYIGFATEAAQDSSELVRTNVTAFSDISITAAVVQPILGDANCDGVVTANDAALALQYVLSPETDITQQGIINIMVVDDTTLTANNAACILQKSLNTEYKFPVELITAE